MYSCWISFFEKRPISFQNQTSQFKIKTTQNVIKKNTCWTQNLNTYIYIYKYVNKSCYFYSYKAWKKLSGSHLNLFYYILCFRLLVYNIKN